MAKKNLTYKQAMTELEKILKKLENNEFDMDNLENEVKYAAELIEMCREKLFNTNAEMDKILKKLE